MFSFSGLVRHVHPHNSTTVPPRNKGTVKHYRKSHLASRSLLSACFSDYSRCPKSCFCIPFDAAVNRIQVAL